MAQKKYTVEQKLDIIDRYEKGESRNSIFRKTGVSTVTIKSWAQKKDELTAALLEESRNKKGTNRKKRYSERLKHLVVNRVLNGEGIYKLSKELEIPYLTIKNWVVYSQNSVPDAANTQIVVPNTDGVIISEEEKAQLREMIAENEKNNSSHEDSLLRTIEQQNAEIAELRNHIADLEEEIMMLKKSAILLAKSVNIESENK